MSTSDLSELVWLNEEIQANIEKNLCNFNPNAAQERRANSCFINIKIGPPTGYKTKDGTPSLYDIAPEEWMPQR